MTKKKISEEIVSIDDVWIHGVDTFDDGAVVKWMKIKDEAHESRFWFLKPHKDVFDKFSIDYVDEIQIENLINVFDENIIDCVYFLTNSSIVGTSSFSINMILGPFAEHLKTHNRTIKAYDLDYLALLFNIFYTDIVKKKSFIKSKTKESFALFLETGFDFDAIRNEQKFWADSSVDISALYDIVYSNNKETIEKGNPDKIGNWIVGQIMKEAKGKADPAAVREYVFNKLKT